MEWISVTKACQEFDRSERTIRRWVKSNKLKGRVVDGNLEVMLEVSDKRLSNACQNACEITARLEAELEARDRQIEILERENVRQHDLLIGLQVNLSNQQQLQAIASVPFYKKWFRRRRALAEKLEGE